VCGQVVGGGGGGRRRRRRRAGGGSAEPKTRTPHKDVGKNRLQPETLQQKNKKGPKMSPHMSTHFAV